MITFLVKRSEAECVILDAHNIVFMFPCELFFSYRNATKAFLRILRVVNQIFEVIFFFSGMSMEE